MSGSQHRVALYLQDKHPLSEAIEYVRYAEAHGFEAVWQAESRLVRDAIVPDGRLCRDDRAHQSRLRRDQQLDAQRGADCRDFFDAR